MEKAGQAGVGPQRVPVGPGELSAGRLIGATTTADRPVLGLRPREKTKGQRWVERTFRAEDTAKVKTRKAAGMRMEDSSPVDKRDQ